MRIGKLIKGFAVCLLLCFRNEIDMNTQEKIMALVRDMTEREREDLLQGLYCKGIIPDDRFRSLVGVDERIFAERLSNYEKESVTYSFENVSDEYLKEMIKEERYGR